MFRWGVRQFISHLPSFECVGEAEDGLSALTKVKEAAPDLVLLDIDMPGFDGLHFLRQLNQTGLQPKVIILSQTVNVDLCEQLRGFGVQGYVLKSEGIDEIGRALESLNHGNTYYSPGIAQYLWTHLNTTPSDRGPTRINEPRAAISQRELQVAKLIGQGLTNKLIAERLGCSANTIKSHRSNLMRKIGAKNSIEVAQIVIGFNKDST